MKLSSEAYNALKGELTEIYPRGQSAIAVLNGLRWPLAPFVLEGKAETIWDSILSYADENRKINELLNHIRKQYIDNQVFKTVSRDIENGSAFIPTIQFPTAIAATQSIRIIFLYTLNDRNIDNIRMLMEQLNVLTFHNGGVEVKFIDMHGLSGGQVEGSARLEHLGGSSIVLPFITAGFFTTENMQLTFAARDMEKRIVPLLVSSCDWGRVRIFSDLVTLPTDRRFIFEAANPDQVMARVTEGVRNVIDHVITDIKAK